MVLLAGEEPGLRVLGDGAHGSGETLNALGKARHQRAIKPWPTTPVVAGGFDGENFVVDESAGSATRPAGPTVSITPHRGALFGIRCLGCPFRDRCTTSKDGRTFHLDPHDSGLTESRRAGREGVFAEYYRRWRSMVERSIAWLVADSHRQVRFRGVARNQLGLSLRIAAVTHRRLVNLGLEHDGEWVFGTQGPGAALRGRSRARIPPSGTGHSPPTRSNSAVHNAYGCELGECRLFNSLLGGAPKLEALRVID